jgi:hypothetical protein
MHNQQMQTAVLHRAEIMRVAINPATSSRFVIQQYVLFFDLRRMRMPNCWRIVGLPSVAKFAVDYKLSAAAYKISPIDFRLSSVVGSSQISKPWI